MELGRSTTHHRSGPATSARAQDCKRWARPRKGRCGPATAPAFTQPSLQPQPGGRREGEGVAESNYRESLTAGRLWGS